MSDFFASRRVVVTGGAGYIGSVTCKALARQDRATVDRNTAEGGEANEGVRRRSLFEGDGLALPYVILIRVNHRERNRGVKLEVVPVPSGWNAGIVFRRSVRVMAKLDY